MTEFLKTESLIEVPYIEVESSQEKKSRQGAAGDLFLSRRQEERGRVVAVLSDGLGSGIKAGVLATLTATMALRCMERDIPVGPTADMIMAGLPVCRERKIRYATFSIADISLDQGVRLAEFDNPPAFLIREGTIVELPWEEIHSAGGTLLRNAVFQPCFGDRLVMMSDGVTQSGMGSRRWPLGWGEGSVRDFVKKTVASDPDISARDLARSLVKRSLVNDREAARDDITAGVIYFRRPRRLLLVTGPPFHGNQDSALAVKLREYPGKRVVCGGTTGKIISRELDRPVEVSLDGFDSSLPPASRMEGVDLITEGILTLGRVSQWLETGIPSEVSPFNPAGQIIRMLTESDQIDLVAGTKINEAHQDPNLPLELEIRRNIVKKIAALLREKHLKEVTLEFI